MWQRCCLDGMLHLLLISCKQTFLAMRQEAGRSPILNRTLGTAVYCILYPADDRMTEDTSEERRNGRRECRRGRERERGRRRLNISMICTRKTTSHECKKKPSILNGKRVDSFECEAACTIWPRPHLSGYSS